MTEQVTPVDPDSMHRSPAFAQGMIAPPGPLLFVGGIRLARPHSPWARWHYQDKPRKMQRALERERYLRRPFVQANLWLQHVIAGEPRVPSATEVDAELDREIHPAPAPAKADTAEPAATTTAAESTVASTVESAAKTSG